MLDLQGLGGDARAVQYLKVLHAHRITVLSTTTSCQYHKEFLRADGNASQAKGTSEATSENFETMSWAHRFL
jgi:hypothetical protein